MKSLSVASTVTPDRHRNNSGREECLGNFEIDGCSHSESKALPIVKDEEYVQPGPIWKVIQLVRRIQYSRSELIRGSHKVVPCC